MTDGVLSPAELQKHSLMAEAQVAGASFVQVHPDADNGADIFEFNTHGAMHLYAQPYDGIWPGPGEHHAWLYGELRGPVIFAFGQSGPQWFASGDLELGDWINGHPALRGLGRELSWHWRSRGTTAVLRWTVQARPLGGGRTHVVMQAGRYGGSDTTSLVGFRQFLSLCEAMSQILPRTDMASPSALLVPSRFEIVFEKIAFPPGTKGSDSLPVEVEVEVEAPSYNSRSTRPSRAIEAIQQNDPPSYVGPTPVPPAPSQIHAQYGVPVSMFPNPRIPQEAHPLPSTRTNKQLEEARAVLPSSSSAQSDASGGDRSIERKVKLKGAADLLRAGQYREAIEAFEAHAGQFPEDLGPCMSQIGAAYFFLGQFERAITCFEQARANGVDARWMNESIADAREALVEQTVKTRGSKRK